MINNIPLSQTVFAGINMDDSEAVANAIKQFCFDDLDHQAKFLQSLRSDLGLTIPKLAEVTAIPDKTLQRFIFGSTAMKPAQIRSVVFLLYIRCIDKSLFSHLLTV